MKTWVEGYKGHKLICTPQRLSDGLFGVKLITQKDLRSEVLEIKVGVKPGVYNSEEDAANASKIAGRQWIDEQG
jgi:hypothetical protein